MTLNFIQQEKLYSTINTQILTENFNARANGFIELKLSLTSATTLLMTSNGNGLVYVATEALTYTGETSGSTDGTGVATVASSILTAASVIAGGTGYIDGERIIIDGAFGANGAIATVAVTAGVITSVTIIDGQTTPVQIGVFADNDYKEIKIPVTTGAFNYNFQISAGSFGFFSAFYSN